MMTQFRRSGWSLPFRPPRSRLFALCWAAAAVILGVGDSFAQSPPVVSGVLNVGVRDGSLGGRMCLGGLRDRDTVTVVLNHALTITAVEQGVTLPWLVEPEAGGNTVRYPIVRERDLQSGERLDPCLTYSGNIPVYDTGRGEYRPDDSAYVLAFNGKTFRARGSSRWYPGIYDPDTRVNAEAAAFRIEIRCPDCPRLYMNGGEAVNGPVATFESAEARELYLLLGDFEVTWTAAGTIVGEEVAPDSAAIFLAELGTIQDFLEEYLGVPYGEELTVVRADPIRAPREGRIWGFLSDPALTFIGMEIPGFVRILRGPPVAARRTIIGYLAHELAHRYFGWTLGIESPQRDVFGEPFATFLELKALRHFVGESEYRSAVRSLARRGSRQANRAPLDLAAPEDLAYDSYRYGYIPTQLFVLERIIGEPRMRELLRSLLTASPAERVAADFGLLRRTAMSIGVTQPEWAEWEDCLRAAGERNSCLASLDDQGGPDEVIADQVTPGGSSPAVPDP